jgi:type IV pilus assembly protein PilF
MSRVVPALLAVVALAGCAVPPPQNDIRTDSDMTDADRRAKLRMELASAYFARGQATTALDEIKQVISARPDLPEAYNLRGLIYASLGQMPLAEESFLRSLQINPREAAAMQNYGWVLCQQQRYDDARVQFDRALAEPQYRDAARTLLAKGLCDARAGRLPDAERSLMRAYELDAANPATAFNLGEVLYRLGEFERARFYLRRVNQQGGQSNAQTLWLAARVENRLGNAAGARSLGEQVRQRFPQSAEALSFERGRFDD